MVREKWPDLAAKIDAGLVSFTRCDHGEGVEPMPASVQVGPAGLLSHCAVCFRPVDYDSLEWVTLRDASGRFGWERTDADSTIAPPAPSSRRLRGVRPIQ